MIGDWVVSRLTSTRLWLYDAVDFDQKHFSPSSCCALCYDTTNGYSAHLLLRVVTRLRYPPDADLSLFFLALALARKLKIRGLRAPLTSASVFRFELFYFYFIFFLVWAFLFFVFVFAPSEMI